MEDHSKDYEPAFPVIAGMMLFIPIAYVATILGIGYLGYKALKSMGGEEDGPRGED